MLYNPPSSNCNTIHQLQSSLAALPDSLPVVFCGDFNLPNIDWRHFNPSPVVHSKENNLLCDAISDFNLQQMVMEPTRGANILDLLFTNRPDILHEVKVVDGLPGSDHDAVYFPINLGRRRLSRQRQLVYNFKKANFDLFREMLSKVPWDCCFLSESINEYWENFKDVLFSVADQCIPKVTLKPKKRRHWLSDETLQLVRKKRRAYKLAKCTGNPHHLKLYRAISNKVRNLTRRDHVDHLELITANMDKDQRPFWRWLKNARGQVSRIPDIHHFGSVLSSAHDKARAFSEYFSTFFVQENMSNMSELSEDLSKSRSQSEILDVLISEEDVYESLCKIDTSKACGPDEVPGHLLREGAPWLAGPLTKLFQLSLSQGCLPSDWTSANITPVFKKGNKHSLTNYRPISLTCL